ncbi:MAG TPA: RMD1 family protein [Stellaceae bacterium]|nr:RMD1 family protein [Stellaceae bacterium]
MADEARPRTLQVRIFLLGERLDTRALERKDSLSASPLTLRLPDDGVAVLFRYGIAALVNVSATEEASFLERIAPCVIEPLPVRETDETQVKIAPSAEEPIDLAGTIFLHDASIARLQLVADVLAKSLVLAHYEASVAGIFDRIEPLTTSLRLTGSSTASGRELLRQIGDVLATQHKMVGRVETGEKPELLWEHPELERLYMRLAEEYELRDRDRALDRKFDVISRTAETLLSILQNRSSLRVEWYILALIVAELILSVAALWR